MQSKKVTSSGWCWHYRFRVIPTIPHFKFRLKPLLSHSTTYAPHIYISIWTPLSFFILYLILFSCRLVVAFQFELELRTSLLKCRHITITRHFKTIPPNISLVNDSIVFPVSRLNSWHCDALQISGKPIIDTVIELAADDVRLHAHEAIIQPYWTWKQWLKGFDIVDATYIGTLRDPFFDRFCYKKWLRLTSNAGSMI